MKFELAGIVVEIAVGEPIAAGLAARYRGYESDAPPDLVVEGAMGAVPPRGLSFPEYPAALVDWDGARYRMWRSDLEAEIDLGPAPGTGPNLGPNLGPHVGSPGRMRVTSAPNTSIFEAALRVAVSLMLPRRGGLLLHSSGVVEHGAAFVFSGHSGAGKTTLVRLLAPPRAPLGDDLVAIFPSDDGRFEARATPFAGEYGVVAPRSAPLSRLHFLVQAPEHLLIPLGIADARTHILKNTLAYAREPETAGLLQDVAARIAAVTPAVRLRFRKDRDVAGALFPTVA